MNPSVGILFFFFVLNEDTDVLPPSSHSKLCQGTPRTAFILNLLRDSPIHYPIYLPFSNAFVMRFRSFEQIFAVDVSLSCSFFFPPAVMVLI